MDCNGDLEKKFPVVDTPEKGSCHRNDEDSESASLEIEIPDGGWGWLIVFASFMCNVIVDGIIFSYGLFLPDLAESFNETKGRLAWVGSLLAGFYLIAGPVVSGLANAYGCRPVTIIGTVISSVSFLVSSFAPNMIFLCITFGLFGGIGFGFIYLPAVVTVGFYFEKRRAFATGLAVCGSGVGTFVMAPLVKYLLGKYAWRGTMLILAGIVLHCAVFGTLFRPLKPKTKKFPYVPKPLPLLQRIKEYRDAQKENWDSEEYFSSAILPEIRLCTSLPEMSKSSRMLSSSEKLCDGLAGSPTGSNNSPPPSYSEVVGEEMFSLLNSNESTQRLPVIRSTLPEKKTKIKDRKSSFQDNFLRPFYRQDILYSASVIHLPEFQSQPDIEHYHKSVIKVPNFDEEKAGKSCCCSPVMRDTFKQMLDLSLLRSPTFLVFSLAGFLTLAGFFVPFMYIIDRAVISGISVDEATYILSMIGFTNTIGRVFSGWVSDRPYLSALTINNIALIVGGLATIFSPFLNSLTLLLLYGAVFGFSIACFATLRSIIIVELLGLDKLTNAFGLLLLFQGIASMIGAPVAGIFYDMTGSYDASFYIAGSVILLSGLLGFPLPYISRWEKNWKTKKILSLGTKIIVTDYDERSPYKPEAV